jgi:hypothetical protein
MSALGVSPSMCHTDHDWPQLLTALGPFLCVDSYPQ